MLYAIVISVHNLGRWVVLILGAWAVYRAYRGWLGKRAWATADRRVGLFLSIVFDLQLLLGLGLMILSPIMRQVWRDIGAALKLGEFRFFIAEHFTVMLVALVIVHLTSVLARKASTDEIRHRRAAIGYTLAIVATVIAIPWWRPLLRVLV